MGEFTMLSRMVIVLPTVRYLIECLLSWSDVVGPFMAPSLFNV